MVLHNLQLARDSQLQSVQIEAGKFSAFGPAGTMADRGLHLHFDHAFAFPGLINSHDHLDFNLFPPLANATYPNYLAWGTDIHQQNKTTIDQVLKIPKALRVQWGLYKNLLNGITTVVHHGPPLPVNEELISVFQQCRNLHSVSLEKYWKLKLNHPGHRGPFVIHIGEGTDALSKREIAELIRWNVFRRPLVGVHGVAMDAREAARFRALVWCPDSNFFLLGKTAAIQDLMAHTRVVFGTDSTVSASWNLWEQLRQARATGLATGQEIIDMLTTTPAWVWQLPQLGDLGPGKQADMVIARKKNASHLSDCFFQLNPEDILLVLHRGEIKMFDASLYEPLKRQGGLPDPFSAIRVRGVKKFVKGDLPALLAEIARYHPAISFPVEKC